MWDSYRQEGPELRQASKQASLHYIYFSTLCTVQFCVSYLHVTVLWIVRTFLILVLCCYGLEQEQSQQSKGPKVLL